MLPTASRLGISQIEETPALEWWPGQSDEQADNIIRAAYRQVLGNAYVMQSERLTSVESRFKRNELTVRELVREIAKSDLYKTRFFDSCDRLRGIELNFRHLLGRTPLDYDELKMHCSIYDNEGYEADIDSYIDSEEYQEAFGDNIVPYIRGYKTEACQSIRQFSQLFQMVRGAASYSLKSDFGDKAPKLNALTITRTPATVINPSPATTGGAFSNPPENARVNLAPGASVKSKTYRLEVTGFCKISRFARSNQVYYVPFDRLLSEYQRIHKQGGSIASVTPV
ncbi:Phycobilisome linker polypeptide (plasmid) [Thalassoporum mexicanum PCC 7367]|uniref:phycobilisome linker polypeptide n=1 Tax=Thalassoporum mexicanum TaxID=3457544 RepID=UPI00029F92D8|nr:phycobilisome linker polypeptide [Pseudanabaena sp. PCC 7367]AFY72115.1 Phycobilisome linker polypeptide [Pseudanabaena sp. PCC 7367]